MTSGSGRFLPNPKFRSLLFSLWVSWALLSLSVPIGAALPKPPDLSRRVSDFAHVLNSAYSLDLDDRLDRLDKKSGLAIYLVLIPDNQDNHKYSLRDVTWDLFRSNQLENKGASGALLIMIETKNGQVAIATSKNLSRKFWGLRAETQIQSLFHRYSKNTDVAVERVVHLLLAIINPWFYNLDPPSVYSKFGVLLVRSPTAEIILFPLAPLLGLAVGAVLMVFTSAGNLPNMARFFVSGCMGCVVVVVTALFIRQPGGIAPGMVYYGASIGFLVSAIVGITRPFWFVDTIRGRKAGEKFHPPFYGGG
jgi:uncharacterized membrane protein YgcG